MNYVTRMERDKSLFDASVGLTARSMLWLSMQYVVVGATTEERRAIGSMPLLFAS